MFKLILSQSCTSRHP